MPEEVYGGFVRIIDRLEESYASMDDLDQFKAILDAALSEIDKLGKKQNE